MFAAALAEVEDSGLTVGLDPSLAMLVEAQRFNSHPRVRYVAGDAAALPITCECVDLALLSRVIHHLLDRQRCAAELHRVLRRGGVVVVRTTVRERLDALVYDYWPRLREMDQARFPSAGMIVRRLRGCGLHHDGGGLLRAAHATGSSRLSRCVGLASAVEVRDARNG